MKGEERLLENCSPKLSSALARPQGSPHQPQTLHRRAHGDQPHVIRHTTNAGPAVRSQRSAAQSCFHATVTHGAPSTHLHHYHCLCPAHVDAWWEAALLSVCSFPEGLCGARRAATPVNIASKHHTARCRCRCTSPQRLCLV